MIVKITDKVIDVMDITEIGPINKALMAFNVSIDGLGIIHIDLDIDEALDEIRKNDKNFTRINRENVLFSALSKMRNDLIELWVEEKKLREVKPNYRDIINKNFSRPMSQELPWEILYKDGRIMDEKYNLQYEEDGINVIIHYKQDFGRKDNILEDKIISHPDRNVAIEMMNKFLEENNYQSYYRKYLKYDKNKSNSSTE